ncbi:hypothetical protein ACMZ6Y_01515 [Streptococcus pluranimalium]
MNSQRFESTNVIRETTLKYALQKDLEGCKNALIKYIEERLFNTSVSEMQKKIDYAVQILKKEHSNTTEESLYWSEIINMLQNTFTYENKEFEHLSEKELKSLSNKILTEHRELFEKLAEVD